MAYPTEPGKVSIHDRFIEVLENIVEGDDYFYTPAEIQGKATTWQERLSDYALEVVFAGAEEAPMHFGGLVIEETFTIIVGGFIRDRDGECQKALVRALRDVRKALFADMVEGSAASLGALALGMKLGPWLAAPGQGTQEGMGHFEQEFKVTIGGDISSL